MATELTWAGDANRSVADQSTAAIKNKWTHWYMVEALLGNIGGLTTGLWTVYYSCDGSGGAGSFGTAGDAVDRWGGATFAAAKIVQAAAASNHSWFVLKAPAGLNNSAGDAPYMIVDCNSATTTTISITFCKTAPTGGTATARPTSTDEWTYATIATNDNSIATNNRVSMMLSSRGDFVFLPVREGAGVFYSIVSLLKPQETIAADLFPWISACIGGGLLNTTSGIQSGGVAGSFDSGSNASVKTRSFDGAALPVFFAISPYSSYNGQMIVAAASTTAGANVSDGTFNDFPCYMLAVGANLEKKGRLPDLKWASGNVAQAQCSPAAAPFEYTKIGHVWLPWVASAVPVV